MQSLECKSVNARGNYIRTPTDLRDQQNVALPPQFRSASVVENPAVEGHRLFQLAALAAPRRSSSLRRCGDRLRLITQSGYRNDLVQSIPMQPAIRDTARLQLLPCTPHQSGKPGKRHAQDTPRRTASPTCCRDQTSGGRPDRRTGTRGRGTVPASAPFTHPQSSESAQSRSPDATLPRMRPGKSRRR